MSAASTMCKRIISRKNLERRKHSIIKKALILLLIFVCIFIKNKVVNTTNDHISIYQSLTNNIDDLSFSHERAFENYKSLIEKFGVCDHLSSKIKNNTQEIKISNFISTNPLPRLVSYENHKAQKFGSSIKESFIEEYSEDNKYGYNSKIVYITLKYYYWCLKHGILTPIIPININEWINSKSSNDFDFSNCEFKNTIDINIFTEKKESLACKTKQSNYYLSKDSGFNPSEIIFLGSNTDKYSTVSFFSKNRLWKTQNIVGNDLIEFLGEKILIESLENEVKHQKAKSYILYPIDSVLEAILLLRRKIDISMPIIDLRNNLGEENSESQEISISEKDFSWAVEDEIEKIESFKFDSNLLENSGDDKNYIEKTLLNIKYKQVKGIFQYFKSNKELLEKNKYFHEVKLSSTIEHVWRSGTHYDWRFFKKLQPISERYEILNRLYDAWSEFAKSQELRYMHSHGNLMSWAWTGGQFLWDNDLDIQLPISDFNFLALNFNNSFIVHQSQENKTNVYYLDINPNYMNNYYGPYGMNTIDGRFIDFHTGLYIDLTALSLKQIEQEAEPKDKNVIKRLKSTWTSQLIKKFGNTKSDKTNKFIGDKHYHFYESIGDISPLRRMKYGYLDSDGYVPNNITKIINEEYPKGLQSIEYSDYKFDPHFHGWVKKCEINGLIDESKNCEGLPMSLFNKVKNSWKRHYTRQIEKCLNEKENDFCEWYTKMHSNEYHDPKKDQNMKGEKDMKNSFFGGLARFALRAW